MTHSRNRHFGKIGGYRGKFQQSACRVAPPAMPESRVLQLAAWSRPCANSRGQNRSAIDVRNATKMIILASRSIPMGGSPRNGKERRNAGIPKATTKENQTS